MARRTDSLQPLKPSRHRGVREAYHERGAQWLDALAAAAMHPDVSVDLHGAIILARTTWTCVFGDGVEGFRVSLAVMEQFVDLVLVSLTDKVADSIMTGERLRIRLHQAQVRGRRIGETVVFMLNRRTAAVNSQWPTRPTPALLCLAATVGQPSQRPPRPPSVDHHRWQCSACRRVFLMSWRATCPGCGAVDYWSGSINPAALAAAVASEGASSTPTVGGALTTGHPRQQGLEVSDG